MAHTIKTGKYNVAGFTLIELLIVLLLIALLAGIVSPMVTSSILRAKESTLKEDLFVLRKAIDSYYSDNGHYPAAMDVLVEQRYIRRLPVDPITEEQNGWILVWAEETNDNDEPGIIDIRSKSDARASDGTAYNEW